MKKAIKSYAERSAERAPPREEPWERSMRSMIRDNFDAIKIDVRKIGTVGVIELLEEERQDHFDAFLAERELKAKARLNRNPLDAEASRQLEWIEAARRDPPFEPFKVASFSQALHLESKERRDAGLLQEKQPNRKASARHARGIQALKDMAQGDDRPTSGACLSGHPFKDDDGVDGAPAALNQAGLPAVASSASDPLPSADAEEAVDFGATASEGRTETAPPPAQAAPPNSVGEAPRPASRRQPRVPQT